MPKLNYIRALLDAMEPEQLRDIIEGYSKQDKSFEAYVIEQSGQAVDTGKTYGEYLEELQKILDKCTSRKGFVKVTRLKKSGLESFQKMLQAHFTNENFLTALWMSLALMEVLHQAILMNTRYRWANKPYKSFENMLGECRDQLDSCIKSSKIPRKHRLFIFEAFVRCWWTERQREYDHHYFDVEDLFRYAKRDEDFIAIQSTVQMISGQTTKPRLKKDSDTFTDKLTKMLLPSRKKDPLDHAVREEVSIIMDRVKHSLADWD